MALSKSATERIRWMDTGGWWISANESEFIELAEALIGYGVPEDAAVTILERAYAVVSSEYGAG